MTTWHFKPAPRRPGTRLTWFQSWIITNQSRYVVGVAARRSGKTVCARALAIMAGLDDGPGDVGYMAPTLGQAKRLLWRPLMQDLRDPAAAKFIEGKPNGSELTIEFKTGVRLYIYSAEAYERVRGTGFKLFITDESDDPLFTDEVFDESIGPALSDNMGRLVQIGTPKGRGRLFREYRKGLEGQHRDPEYSTIQVSAMEAGIIQRSEILRAKKSRPKRAFEQEYLATFNAPVGLVYDEWNEERHVVDVGQMPREFDEYIVGVDWGTANRGVMLVCGVDRVWVKESDDYEGQELARVWVVEEHAEAGVPYTDEGWWKTARQIQRQYRPKRWYCDPSGGSDEATAARAEGYLRQLQNALADVDNTARVVPADNRLSPGISAVQGFIHYDDILKEPPRLHVMDTCKRTITEFNSYRWAANPRSEDEYEDRPTKVNDHCLVAGTVVAAERGPVPIEEIVPGELVHTREGLRPVLGAGLTQESAPIWRMVTSDGSSVEGTGNHLAWTGNREWVRLDELRSGDLLERHGARVAGSTSVACVVFTGRLEPVYDLTVDGAHEFYANGILVHNCMDALRYATFTHFYGKRGRGGRNDAGWQDRGG